MPGFHASGKHCEGAITAYLYWPTEGPVPGEHVDEVGDDVERGIECVSDGEVHDEVVGHRAHPRVGEHDPDHCK